MNTKRLKKPEQEEFRDIRKKLYQQLLTADLSIGQATKIMRKSLGLTQEEYSLLIKVSARTIKSIEQDKGNPRFDVLTRIAKPFGLVVGFIPKV